MDALDLVQFYWHDYGVEKYVGAAQRLQVLAPQTPAVPGCQAILPVCALAFALAWSSILQQTLRAGLHARRSSRRRARSGAFGPLCRTPRCSRGSAVSSLTLQ